MLHAALELILVNVTEDASAVVELAIAAMVDAIKVTAEHTQQLKQAMDDATEVCISKRDYHDFEILLIVLLICKGNIMSGK